MQIVQEMRCGMPDQCHPGNRIPTNKDKLAEALETVYGESPFKHKRLILSIIDKNELKQALRFIERLKQGENALELKNEIENVYIKLIR